MKTKVTFQDLVTKVDVENQKMIRECAFGYRCDLCRFMQEKYPTHALLGEEDVEWGKDKEVILGAIGDV